MVIAVSEGQGVGIVCSIVAKKVEAAGLVKIVKIREAKDSGKLY